MVIGEAGYGGVAEEAVLLAAWYQTTPERVRPVTYVLDLPKWSGQSSVSPQWALTEKRYSNFAKCQELFVKRD